MKNIKSFEIIDHGVENSQYFQGCGVAFTEFTDVATGIGDSAADALEDALEFLAQNDWDTKLIEIKYPFMSKKNDVPANSEDVYHYVSVRVK